MMLQLFHMFHSVQIVATRVQVRNNILTQEQIQFARIENAVVKEQRQIIWNR